MTPTTTGQQQDSFFWQGSLMTIRARATDTAGALGLVEGSFPEGFGPPLHVHTREDEGFYVIEGDIRFRQGDEEFVGHPGTWVWGPRGVAHAFRVESATARALVVVTPGGFERMFEEGGVPAAGLTTPPAEEYDPEAAVALAGRFGFEVVGPPLGDR
jgi:quercetin dioxygenase-like cupin family protein